jgi:hypothetical protein
MDGPSQPAINGDEKLGKLGIYRFVFNEYWELPSGKLTVCY